MQIIIYLIIINTILYPIQQELCSIQPELLHFEI